MRIPASFITPSFTSADNGTGNTVLLGNALIAACNSTVFWSTRTLQTDLKRTLKTNVILIITGSGNMDVTAERDSFSRPLTNKYSENVGTP